MLLNINKVTVYGTVEPATIDHKEIRGIAPSSRHINGEATTRIYTENGSNFRIAGAFNKVQTDLRRATKKAIPVIGETNQVDLSRVE